MFEMLTPQARRLVVEAQQEALNHGSACVGTEHLLIALLNQPDAAGTQTLIQLGIDIADLQQRTRQRAGQGPPVVDRVGPVPFTSHATTSLTMSKVEALQLLDNHIGTEHILLGLLRADGSTAAGALLDADADPAFVRRQIRANRESRGPAPN